MGMLSGFFVSSDEALREWFRMWYENSGKRIRREAKNPFTGEMQEYWEWQRGERVAIVDEGKPNTATDSDIPYHFWKNVDPVMLAALNEILSGNKCSVDDFLVPALIPPQHQEDLLIRLPRDWIESMATVPNTKEVAQKWAATEECILDNWSTEDAAEVLTGLMALAKSAVETNRGMFLEIRS